MTKVFLKNLGPFYYEKMVASVLSDFTKMVRMGIRLGEVIREGRLSKDKNYGSTKKHAYGFSKKK